MIKLLPIVICDSRERVPLSFEEDPSFSGVIVKKLDAGDYSLAGLEQYIVIERKVDCNEVWGQFCSKEGRERFHREMERMQSVSHRFIVIEQDLEDFTNPESYFVNQRGRNKFAPGMPAAVVMRELIHFMLFYNVHVIFAGAKAPNLIKKLLLQAYELYGKKI